MLAYVRDPRAPRALVRAAALSAANAAFNLLIIRGLLAVLGAVPAQEKWVYVGTIMAFVVAAIPALPGAWGTTEATYVVFFGLAGVGSGVALGVSLLYRLFSYIWAVVGAILYVTRSRASALDAGKT